MKKDLITFKLTGRLSRMNFLIGVVLTILTEYTINSFISGFITIMPQNASVFGFLKLVVSAICMWLLFSVTVRRFHDLGWSALRIFPTIGVMVFAMIGGYTLLNSSLPQAVLSVMSLIFLALLIGPTLIILFKKGTSDENKYGPNPLKKEIAA